MSGPDPYRRALLRQTRSRRTRERLVRAALRLWRARGYDEVTVDEICAEAGVGNSTFYYHFPGKDGLLDGLAVLTVATVDAEVGDDPGPGVEERLGRVVDGLSQRIAPMPRDVVAAVVERALGSIGHLGPRDVSASVSLDVTLARVLRAARDEGALAATVDADELAAVVTAMLMEGILRWARGSTPSDDLVEVLRSRIALVLRGSLLTPPEAALGWTS